LKKIWYSEAAIKNEKSKFIFSLNKVDRILNISWQFLYNLEQVYGDSFYLLNLQAFQDNYDEFLEAFRSIYSNSHIAYSYKTNYIPKLCQLVNSKGGYAEVVSGMEYDFALRVGVSPQRIIFNGPYKSQSEIEKALLAGSIVNLDSIYEVEFVKAIAQRSPENLITVGIRCNFDIGENEISRFGFDIEGKAFKTTFETLDSLKNCIIGGLHCHFSTRERSLESYTLRTRKILDLSTVYFESSSPRFIDIGGGFFSKMSEDLRRQFGCYVPTYQEYANAIAPQVARKFPDSSGPELILEPGSAITANTMKFVAKIIDIKTVRSQKIALASGSIHNIKPTLNNKNLSIFVVSNNVTSSLEKISGAIDIVGYTCMETDYLYKGYQGALAVGDYIVFDNVGAYTVVLKPPFIRPSPTIIEYDSTSNRFDVIKRQEELLDVFSTYNFR
jgi:diaminopimelate decarboxylase